MDSTINHLGKECFQAIGLRSYFAFRSMTQALT